MRPQGSWSGLAYLADVNFLVALLHERHAQSRRAVAWLDSHAGVGSVALCRVAQMGALRALTNRVWLADEVHSAAEVWRAWDLLSGDERFISAAEPARLEIEWRRLTSAWPRGRMVETDAYFAAFASAAGFRLLSFDTGLRRFPGVEIERP